MMKVSFLTQGLLLLVSASVMAQELKIEQLHVPDNCNIKAKSSDKIKVHYKGWLEASGEVFDESYSRGSPLSFPLGKGRVIKGWDQGLLDSCIGEKRRVTIPPELGYGQTAIGPIPAGSTLVFETEMMEINGQSVDSETHRKEEL